MDCWFSKYLVLRRELHTPEDFTFLGSETAQMPTAMMHSPACTGLRAQPSGNQNSWWVSQGCDQENLTFVHSLYQLFFTHVFFVCFPEELFFPFVFLFLHLCVLFLAGTGNGIAEQQKLIQLYCWLNPESLFSSDFTAAFQISVPKNFRYLSKPNFLRVNYPQR